MADKTSPILTKPQLLLIGLGVLAGKNTYETEADMLLELQKRTSADQVEQIAEWGNEPCPHYPESGWIQKRMCLECWQFLLEKEG